MGLFFGESLEQRHTKKRLETMDPEERHVEVQREASAAGLIVGIFILFLLVIGGFALVALWPAIHLSSTPLPPPSLLKK